MPHPAVLDFDIFSVLFLQHHFWIGFLNSVKAFGLDNFQVGRNLCPFVIKQLICVIFIDKRNPSQAREYLIRNSRLLVRYYDFRNLPYQSFVELCVKSLKSRSVFCHKALHVGVRLNGLYNVIRRHGRI